MNMDDYRASHNEQLRVRDLMGLISKKGSAALDIGARDGFLSNSLTEYFDVVTALDLDKPDIDHHKITSVAGNIISLDFPNDHFDMVLCAEVLEHIPPSLLEKACSELMRVSKEYLIIGVPYKQDIRVGRTTCYTCGKTNPPWGHVNKFDEFRLQNLFFAMSVEKISYVGKNNAFTNFLSSSLMDLAGNPYGTYSQEEPCIHCGNKLIMPPQRNFLKKLFTKLSFSILTIQKPFVATHPNWIHILFKK